MYSKFGGEETLEALVKAGLSSIRFRARAAAVLTYCICSVLTIDMVFYSSI